MDFDEPNKLLNSDFNDANMFSSPTMIASNDPDDILPEYKEELTTKKALELLIEGTLKSKVCRYCLNIAPSLSELDQVLQIAGSGSLYKVTIREMVASFHPFKAATDKNLPSKICDKCLDHTISAYLFTQQCERSERALRNCFDDMYEKLEKLDPLDRTNKRGRQKRNPNYNVIYTENRRVVDYAQPVISIVNVKSVSLSKEPAMSDLECPKCWQLFSKIEDLIIHEKTHPYSMWFNCRLCGKSFVKRIQLKRHLKQTHSRQNTKTRETDIDDSFLCKTCDFTSTDHSSHLQHMEKHKFQTVLEHLVERDMDKLCAVCLGKEPNLVDLDKMVCLHGGYPGATGDKTLYSILGATIPERNSYKYQELHVPHQAKVMKFVKLTKDKKSDHNQTPNISEESENKVNLNQIVISNPLIISNEKFDSDEMYLFFFSDPSHYNEKQINSIQPNHIIELIEHKESKEQEPKPDNVDTYETPENADEKDIYKMDKGPKGMKFESKMITNAENINDKHQYPVIDSVNKDNAKGIINDEKLCETCLIFKKPTCASCLEKLTNVNDIFEKADITTEKEIIKECKYCWAFKRTKRCEICKKNNIEVSVNEIFVKDDITTEKIITKECKYCLSFKKTKRCEICKKENIVNTAAFIIEQDIINKEVVDIPTDYKTKRKFMDGEIKFEKNMWDCNVCLISNIPNRKTCICCESNKEFQNNVIKVNFDGTNPFKITKTDAHIDQEIDTNMDVSPKNIIDLHNKTIDETSATHQMEKCLPTPPESFTSSSLKAAEEMEIVDDEDTSPTVIPSYPNPFSFNIAVQDNIRLQSSGLLFNIGARPPRQQVSRRFAKPIRKMAYHK